MFAGLRRCAASQLHVLTWPAPAARDSAVRGGHLSSCARAVCSFVRCFLPCPSRDTGPGCPLPARRRVVAPRPTLRPNRARPTRPLGGCGRRINVVAFNPARGPCLIPHAARVARSARPCLAAAGRSAAAARLPSERRRASVRIAGRLPRMFCAAWRGSGQRSTFPLAASVVRIISPPQLVRGDLRIPRPKRTRENGPYGEDDRLAPEADEA